MQEVNLNGQSLDIVNENVEKLKSLFPEIVTEDKIDFDKLQDILGNYIEKEEEHYRFTWYGKRDAFRKSQIPSTGTLRPFTEESKDWDNTGNLYIEGDNLEVLKLLQKSYNNSIKMIYIDPPYNKDKDFVYSDKWSDPIKEYKKITGQVNDEGNVVSSDTEGAGGRHTNWLNMMYPRLRMARNLLTDDGVVFISIDDDEVENLRKLCDEMFGENNFIARIVHKNNSMKNQTKLIGVTTEYVLIYSKEKEALKNSLWRITKKGAKDIATKFLKLKSIGIGIAEIEHEIKEMFTRPKYSHLSRWNKVDEDGVFMDSDLSRENGPKNYTIINPDTGENCVIPNRGWGKSYEELLYLQERDLIWYGDMITPPRMKNYIEEDDVMVPDNFWYFDNSIDTRWIKETFSTLIFENPKPLQMIKQIVQLHTSDKDIIMDFFSGSATTAHAVMELNAQDGGNRKYIMVQLPENLDIALTTADQQTKQTISNSIEFLDTIGKPHLLTEIGKERIRRAGDKIKEELIEKYNDYLERQHNSNFSSDEQPPMKPEDLDTGFKVFKLDSSNLQKWSLDVGKDFYKKSNEEQKSFLAKALEEQTDNFVKERSELDLVYEIMLKYGLDLSNPIETYSCLGINVYSIDFGGLFICLHNHIKSEFAEEILKLIEKIKPKIIRVAVRDLSFDSDKDKVNFKNTLKNGVEDYFENADDKTSNLNQFDFITI